jgi:hypothetical protein
MKAPNAMDNPVRAATRLYPMEITMPLNKTTSQRGRCHRKKFGRSLEGRIHHVHLVDRRAPSMIPIPIERWADGSPETIMFGFQGGETAEVAVRKRGHMKDSQQKWEFLTNFDCSTIKTEWRLCLRVKTRASLSEEQSKLDVSAWMHGRLF